MSKYKVITCSMVLLFLSLCGCENKEPLTFENILYSDQLTEDTVCGREKIPENRYGCVIYSLLNNNNGTTTMEWFIQWGDPHLNRYTFVPEYVGELTKAEVENEKKATNALLKDFWRTWINKLYGNEGAWYRLKAKLTPMRWRYTRSDSEDLGRAKYSSEVEVLIEQSAAGNDPEGLYLYGVIRFRLDDYKPVARPEEGWPALIKAAELGWGAAMYEIGWAYLKGWYVEQDYAQAKHYLNMALDRGYFEAANAMSILLEKEALQRGEQEDHAISYYYYIIARGSYGDLLTMDYMRRKIGNEEQAVQAEQKALAFLEEKRTMLKQEEADLVVRWNAMVPDIKQAIYRDIPWLVWTMAPDDMRKEYRERYVQGQATAATVNGH